jgi:hypothetical protein
LITPYPYIIKEFFTEEEYAIVSNYMKSLLKEKSYIFLDEVKKRGAFDKWVINHIVGRINISIDKLYVPEELKSILSKNSKYLNPNSEFKFIEFVRYSKDFGNPRIDPHIDPPSKQAFMFNLQLDANIEWPLVEYITDKTVETVLNNNECAVMDVDRIVHWRKPQLFKDGDYVDMIFIHFTDESIEPYPKEWYPHPPEWKKDQAFINSIRYEKEMLGIYPSTKTTTQDELGQQVKDRINSIGIKSIIKF